MMGFLDKAKAAAADLQQKADTAMSNSGLMGGSPMAPGGGGSGGPADRLLRDLGVLTYLNAAGRPGSAADYQRIMEQLRSLEGSGQLHLTLSPAAPPGYGAPGAPPPPPGAVRAAHDATRAGGVASAPPAPPAGMPTAPGAGAPPPPPGVPSDSPAMPAPLSGTPEANDPTADPVIDEPAGTGGGSAPPPPPPSWA